MKGAMSLIFLALVATSMAGSVIYTVSVPVDRRPIPVSEAILALQSGSSLLSAGNGLYQPVEVVNGPVPKNSVPLSQDDRLIELVN